MKQRMKTLAAMFPVVRIQQGWFKVGYFEGVRDLLQLTIDATMKTLAGTIGDDFDDEGKTGVGPGHFIIDTLVYFKRIHGDVDKFVRERRSINLGKLLDVVYLCPGPDDTPLWMPDNLSAPAALEAYNRVMAYLRALVEKYPNAASYSAVGVEEYTKRLYDKGELVHSAFVSEQEGDGKSPPVDQPDTHPEAISKVCEEKDLEKELEDE